MRSISQIVSISIHKLLAKKTLYFLLFLLILVIGGVSTQLYRIITESAGNDQVLLAEKADVLGQIMQVWSQFTVFFAMIYGAGAIYNEIKSKSIVAVLAKPVSRTEYLVGRWVGVVMFFTIFVLLGTGIILIFMYLWEIPITSLFITGIINKIGILFVYSGIAFVLSLFIQPIVGGGVAFILYIFRNMFEMMMASSKEWIEIMGYVLFYLSPAVVKDNLIQNGIMDNMLNPNYGLYWRIISENFLYAGILVFAGVLLYQNKDIILD